MVTDENILIANITESEEYSFETRTEIHRLNEAIMKALPKSPDPVTKPVGIKLPKLTLVNLIEKRQA